MRTSFFMQRTLIKRFISMDFTWLLGWCMTLVSYGEPAYSYSQPDHHFEQGMELFNHHHYEAARVMMEDYKNQHPDGPAAIEAAYYAALCALRLGRQDGEARLQQFMTTYPQHHHTNWAHYELGNVHVRQQGYDRAVLCYQAIDTATLTPSLYAALHYQWGYAYLHEKRFEEALEHFNAIKTINSPYKPASNYYAGYMALKKEDYVIAQEDLHRAEEDVTYQPMVAPLILQGYYQQKQFDGLLAYATQPRFEQPALDDQPDIHFFIAEAYFYLQNYPKAIQHYQTYLRLQTAPALPAVYYRLGYALYCQGEWVQALKNFQAIALDETEQAQMASYYMGLIYRKLEKKNEALLAFDHAHQLSFVPEIQQEALLEYGQLCCELGNTKTAMEALAGFKKNYPGHSRIPWVDKLLTALYFNSHNYEQTISYIEGLSNHPKEIQRLYQQATFYKGITCFNHESYEEANHWLQKSLTTPLDTGIMLKSHLWMGESWAAQQEHEEAAKHYHTVLNLDKNTSTTYQDALYGLGYVYFNTGRYQQALTYFQSYIASVKDTQLSWYTDALVRIGDCCYMLQAYPKALSTYQNTEKSYPAHSQYQIGLIYDIQDNYQQAQGYIEKVITDHVQTPYYEKALFARAKMALKYQEYPTAVQAFTFFLEKKPHSPLVPAALLHRALAQTNQQNLTAACADYEQLVNTYPTDPAAQGAILELSRLLLEKGQSDKLQPYIEQYKSANPTSQTVETIHFETAKNLFYTQHYPKAIEQLTAFMEAYPTSSFLKEVHFLLAETYYRSGKTSQALETYTQAYHNKPTPFYPKILLRLASLCYQQDDFDMALAYYQELYEQATNKKEAYYALEGKMKSGAALHAYQTVQEAASQILATGEITINATSQATIYLGKAALEEGKIQEALTYFRQIVQKDQGNYAAEAQYYIASIHYQLGDYKLSLEDLFILQKNFSNYTEWTNKGFFLIAENYVGLAELFQARATLQSIIDHGTDTALVEQARTRLTQLTPPTPADEAEPTPATTSPANEKGTIENDASLSTTTAAESIQPAPMADSTPSTDQQD